MYVPGKFSFTVTEAARFLGKSAVTLRMWERRGLVAMPRLGTDRRFSIRDLRELAAWAHSTNRIGTDRLHLVEAGLTVLELIESEDRNPRSTRGGQVKVHESTSA